MVTYPPTARVDIGFQFYRLDSAGGAPKVKCVEYDYLSILSFRFRATAGPIEAREGPNPFNSIV